MTAPLNVVGLIMLSTPEPLQRAGGAAPVFFANHPLDQLTMISVACRRWQRPRRPEGSESQSGDDESLNESAVRQRLSRRVDDVEDEADEWASQRSIVVCRSACAASSRRPRDERKNPGQGRRRTRGTLQKIKIHLQRTPGGNG